MVISSWLAIGGLIALGVVALGLVLFVFSGVATAALGLLGAAIVTLRGLTPAGRAANARLRAKLSAVDAPPSAAPAAVATGGRSPQ